MPATRLVVVALLVCSALGLVLLGWDSSGDAAAGASPDFPLLNAGETVDGLPLVAVTRRADTAEYVSFVYGDCTPRDDEGCAPPAEVQVWPACRRNLSLYESRLAGTPEPQLLKVRGVPAAFLEGGLRLELQTSRSTIVVFGDSQARVLRVAAALRPLGAIPSSDPLPAPAPGAPEGTLSC
jgi:hypothetical protein